MEGILLKVHLLFTLYMCGLIWFVQIVHYPLFRLIRPEQFTSYEQGHTRLTAWLTAPQMTIELFSAAALIYVVMDNYFYWFNFLGVLLIWVSTFFIQVPLHNQLSQKHDPKNIQNLIKSNWARTILWTIRAIALILYL